MDMASPWHRNYSGSYTNDLFTKVDGRPVMVRFTVRHMPEWKGADRWAVEASWKREDGRETTLVEVSDAPARTFADAKRTAFALAAGGFRFHPGLGFCATGET